MAAPPPEEGSFTTTDGEKLYTKTWRAIPEAVKARLVFIHGFSDHCNNYEDLFSAVAENGITVYSFDQRGWGRSVDKPAKKGLTGPTSLVLSDITDFIKQLPIDDSQSPLFLMGHSMGGAEVVHYIASGPTEILSSIRGFLLESPFISVHPSTRPSSITVTLGRLAGRILPHRQMVNKLDPKKICRDPVACQAYADDPLCHDTGTLEGLAGMLDRADELQHGRAVVKEGMGECGKTRLWCGHGTSDMICDYETCRKWYDGVEIEDKEMRVYEGWYHRLHAEPGEDKVKFLGDMTKWIFDRCGEDVQGQTAASGERSRL
ncbi:hypothetical protein LTR78_004875 [Recurvomyces mirabilis]|uniref:Serine aminopeptidase S33 domain-containing protein n=1 Tax=Recurvomyces mirabilis TaxID=574656 RepID=A0AAE1C294_9PEZI|nr:hypothetical protein LTR78_004875 [Recurvomyces mirabilis]KAK5158045.1 hypothetical protein LTS14_003968 [Recurvomyces mirabilis]